jgi:hypothetical protein
MAVKNKVNENRLDYEPWGYRVDVGYTSKKTAINATIEKFFTNVKYSKKDEKIHFYNLKGEEKGSINVNDFSSGVIKGTSYDAATKILTIKYENGKSVSFNLTPIINSIVEKIDENISVLSGTVEEIINNEMALQSAAFSDSEYVWDEDNKKMVIRFYNTNSELKDTIELFDTNDEGEVMIEAGKF